MIRIFSILAGLFFILGLVWSMTIDTIAFTTDGWPTSAEKEFHEEHPKALSLSSDGPFGKFDKQQLQRGYAVYSNVCAQCHSLKHVAYRDLADLGYTPNAIKAIAAKATINAKDPLSGEVKDRPGQPADHFAPVVYGGKGVPPDLSLITKAREGGAAYVYSLITGYATVPAALTAKYKDFTVPDDKNQLHYNPYFANLNIAMPPPLASDDLVTYSDGTKATKDQMAQDVSAFLVWTAEPKLEQRHQTGFMWLGLMLFVTVLSFMAYRNVWSGTKH